MQKHIISKSAYYSLFVFFGLNIQILHAQELPIPYNQANLRVNVSKTWSSKAPEQNANNIMNRSFKDVTLTINYLDGLGRVLQTVIKQGSLATSESAPTDLVNPVIYDQYGRKQFKFLPYSSLSNNGSFKLDPFGEQKEFYLGNTSPVYQQGETYFYNKVNFDQSPLNRVEESYASGNNWVGSETASTVVNKRSVKSKHWLNTEADLVRIWKVDDVLNNFGDYNTPGTYLEGELYKTVIEDESGKQIIEFKDIEGRLILKKVQLTATTEMDPSVGSNHDNWLCTYYIYDDLGNLRCVVQPEGVKWLAVNNWSFTATGGDIILKEQCFRYEYNARNRMIMKKVPGVGEVYMVYDARDRLVMSQDAAMRSGTQRKWLYTVYDEFNRPIETGLMTDNSELNFHIEHAANSTSYPNLAQYTTEKLTITHYDDYTGLPGGLSSTYLTTWNGNFSATDIQNWPYPVMPQQSSATKGMVTWTQTKVLNSSPEKWIYTCIFYDDKGRPIQVQSKNELANSTNVVSTQYSWAGQPLITVAKSEKTGTNAQTTIVVTKLTYDDLGRLVKTEKKQSNTLVNGGNMSDYKSIADLKYNKLGQLNEKRIAPYYNNNSGLETQNYEYNIRGWMLGMNREYTRDANSTNYFGFDLGYDKQNNNLIGNQTYSKAQYNGNIAGMVWKSRGDGEKRKYDFDYDAANRIMKADFSQYTGSSFNQNAGVNFNMKMGDDGADVNSAYDYNGNIKRMQHWGLKIGGSTQIDDMSYTYQPNSNKLAKVTDGFSDTQTKLGDFKDGTNGTSDDYSYDVNGNLTLDNNKGITSITYNYLNLPSVITIAGKGTITYTYDAAGNKLKKEVTDNTTSPVKTTTTLYAGGIVYENDVLQFIGMEEGRMRVPTLSTGALTWAYDYMLKDHLGNVRMVLTDEIPDGGTFPALTFEGAANSTEVNNQNTYWDNKNGQSVDVTNVRTGRPGGFGSSQNNGDYAILLRKSTGSVGPTKLIKVMSGDHLSTRVEYFYTAASANNSGANGWSSFIGSLLSYLNVGNAAGSLVKGQGAIITDNLGNTPAATGFFVPENADNTPNQSPKAYLHVLLFDEMFKFDSQNSFVQRVDYKPNNKGEIEDFNREVKKNGYAYVYISNESDEMVYFDNLTLTHNRGPILEENHYYPFGLTMAGISSKANQFGNPQNKIKYNGKEEQRQEFSDGSGLEWLDYGARMYDNQVGKWTSVDPVAESRNWLTGYNYVQNNPIIRYDPNGKVDWKKNSEGNYEYDADLTKENAKEKLGKGEEYLGASYKVNIVTTDKNQKLLNTYSLNEDGSVTDAKGNSWNDNFGEISLGTKGGERIINHLTISDFWNSGFMRAIINDQYTFGVGGNAGVFLGGGAEPLKITLLTRGQPGLYFLESTNSQISSGADLDGGIVFSRGNYTGKARDIKYSYLGGLSTGINVGLGAGIQGSVGVSYAPVDIYKPFKGGFVNINGQIGIGAEGSPATIVNVKGVLQWTPVVEPLIKF